MCRVLKDIKRVVNYIIKKIDSLTFLFLFITNQND
jgi:hypothetical protein